VLIKFPSGTLGDVVAWFPYAQVFKHVHYCQVFVTMDEKLAGTFAPSYPDLVFVGPEERPHDIYATYYMGIFFPCDDRIHQPVDFRITGLQKTIPHLLGLEPVEVRPIAAPRSLERTIEEPYVCIATQSTTQAKYWNNPTGWLNTIKHLKDKGYRVLCIDQEPLEHHPLRGGGLHRRPPAAGEGRPPPPRRLLRRPVERPVVAGVGGGQAGRHGERLHAAAERILHTLPADKLPCVQRLLERRGDPVRPRRLRVVPAP